MEDIDVPLRQRHLSQAIDEAASERLLQSADSIRVKILAISSSLPHAGDWLNIVPSAHLGLHLNNREFRCCLSYWLGVPLHSAPYTPVQSAATLQTPLGITRWAVGATETASLVTTQFMTSFSLPPNLLP